MRPFVLAGGVLALGLALAAQSGARAQSTPAPAPTPIVLPTLPPNTPNSQWIQTGVNILRGIYDNEQARNRNNARGTVTYFKRFDMQVQLGANSYRTVHLHQGTVINPRGATPGVGTSVDINGTANADGSLEANTITVVQ